MKIIHVTNVEHAGGYKLRLTFSDGTVGTADLADHLTGPFARLHNVDRFAEAYIDARTVCWPPGDLDLAPEYLYALAHDLDVPKTVEDVERNEAIVGLRALRELIGVTQAELAAGLGLAQADISKLESRSDVKLSSLARYVQALGGRLELVARVGGRTLQLDGLLPTSSGTSAATAAINEPKKKRRRRHKVVEIEPRQTAKARVRA